MLTGEFLRLSARRAPGRTAIIGAGRRLTYRELDTEANQLAHVLQHLGAGRDTRVAIMSGNRPEYAAVYFGAAGIKTTRHALPACLLADVAGILAAVFIVNLMFG